MIRADLSTKLIHLTRTVDNVSADVRFNQILTQGKLIGSDRDVRGGLKVVAFTESPISMFASILANAKALDMRYAPLGVMVDKTWLYKQGGRPVIYESNAEFDDLPESKQHLHVRYEPDRNIDYSWEREWRIKCDSLTLDPKATTVVVPTRDWEAKYHSVHAGRRNRSALITHGFALDRGPLWHFVSLEDLGVPFDGLKPISFESVS